MANGGNLLKRLSDQAAYYDAMAKWAGTTPEQEWLELVQQDPSSPPPHALPPYVFTKLGFGMNSKQLSFDVKAQYQRLSPWGFLVHEVVRPIPRNTPIEQITFVGPDAVISVHRMAERAVKARVEAEERVGFPNNLDRKQLARVRFLDPTGEKTARAREMQAANMAAKERAFDAFIEARERIRDEVVAGVKKDNALEEIAHSGADLFMVLYTAMTDLAVNSDEVFTRADLKDLWHGIIDDVAGLTNALLDPKLKAVSPDTGDPLKKLWLELLDALRTAGQQVIDQPRRFADDEPGAAKTAWDAFLDRLREAGQELIREPEQLVSRDASLDDLTKDHRLSVYYDYSSFIGHFFVELRTNKNETFFFGKYPQQTFDAAGRDAVPFLVRWAEEGLGRAVQAALRDFALAIYGPGRVLRDDDKRRLTEEGKGDGAPSLQKILGAKSQITRAQKEIPLSRREFEELKRKLEERQSDPRNYVLVWDNCATLTEDLLDGKATLEEMFPLGVRLQSLAGLYVTIFPKHANADN